MRKPSKSGGMPRRVTAADSLRNRKSSSSSLERIEERERERENSGWLSLSRRTLFTDDVIGAIMPKKDASKSVVASNFRPADIDEDRRRNSQFLGVIVAIEKSRIFIFLTLAIWDSRAIRDEKKERGKKRGRENNSID